MQISYFIEENKSGKRIKRGVYLNHVPFIQSSALGIGPLESTAIRLKPHWISSNLTRLFNSNEVNLRDSQGSYCISNVPMPAIKKEDSNKPISFSIVPFASVVWSNDDAFNSKCQGEALLISFDKLESPYYLSIQLPSDSNKFEDLVRISEWPLNKKLRPLYFQVMEFYHLINYVREAQNGKITYSIAYMLNAFNVGKRYVNFSEALSIVRFTHGV